MGISVCRKSDVGPFKPPEKPAYTKIARQGAAPSTPFGAFWAGCHAWLSFSYGKPSIFLQKGLQFAPGHGTMPVAGLCLPKEVKQVAEHSVR